MELFCTVVSDVAELEGLRPEWEALLARSDCNEPMLSPPWMLSWWRVFGRLGGRRLAALSLHAGGRLRGLWLLCTRRVWTRPGVPFRRIEAMGSGEDEEDEIASDYIGAVVERGAEDAAAEALSRALASGALGAWDELVLPAMDGSRKLPFCVAEALSRKGFLVSLRCTGGAPHIPLPSTWRAYLAALSSSRRYLVNRSLRDFEAWAGEPLTLTVAQSLSDLARMKPSLVSLHEKRWSGQHGSGAFASPRFAAFHDAVMPSLLSRGALELAELCVRGEPVAALYNIIWNDKVYFYQSGRRPDLPRKLRPGIVAHALCIQRAIAARRREYDFLNGESRYKTELALATRPIVVVRAARPSLREALRGQAERGVELVHRLSPLLAARPSGLTGKEAPHEAAIDEP
jgi:CelD/BcsL family acetyltransferase involved in cellulose biosynthesis